MLTTRELQDEIIRLKKEKDICILAHAYQSHDIWEVADYVGDSYGLSVQAAKAAQSTVLMCGVRFMAETVKILSPQKRVLLSNSNAGCPMAEQMDKPLITMSMSRIGSISRISGEAFGSAVTFGSIGQESAPGQLPVNKLEEMLDMIHQNYQ